MIKISQFPNISTRFRGLLCNLPVLRRSGQPDPHARRHLHPRRVLLCVWRLPLWTPSQLPYLLYQGHHHEHDLCNHRLLPFCIGWFCFPPDCDVWSCYKTKTFKEIREGVKKREKAVRLTAWVDPPSPEAVRKMWKFLDKLPYLGLFCRFIKDKNGSKFSQIEVVRLRGGDPPSPPKAVSLTAFSQFLFDPFP